MKPHRKGPILASVAVLSGLIFVNLASAEQSQLIYVDATVELASDIADL